MEAMNFPFIDGRLYMQAHGFSIVTVKLILRATQWGVQFSFNEMQTRSVQKLSQYKIFIQYQKGKTQNCSIAETCINHFKISKIHHSPSQK